MDNFNNSQQKAIRHFNGPAIILAGPGSGKTTVITNRTRYLIEQQGINPSNILVITFTKAAATQMQERFLALMDKQSVPVTFGTFHAVFFKILKYAYHYNASNIAREDIKRMAIKDIIHKLQLEFEDENDFINEALNEISTVKNERIPIESYYPSGFAKDIFVKIYQSYEQCLRKQNVIDFDDMMVFCYELFVQRKDILAAWQKKYKYILIDEFQDINMLQYDIIKMLALPENNLFIVGDDDQSIYRFRGAKPKIMLDFEKDYPDAAQIILDINYRSTPDIVDAAKNLMKNNHERYNKDIKSCKTDGSKVIYSHFNDQSEEILCIIKIILNEVKLGSNYSDYAVIYRTNLQPRVMVLKMMEYNIPFTMKDSIPNIYEHWIAKDIFTYIRIAKGSTQRKDFLRIINKPKRYISRDCFDYPQVTFEELYTYYADKRWMCERIEKLQYDINVIKDMPPYAAINYIINGIEYDQYLKDYAEYRRIKLDDLIEILNEIHISSKDFKTVDKWMEYIEDYTIKLKEQYTIKNTETDSVTFATMHSCKGLEYKNVFIIDANEGITPYKKALTDADIEEERRMFYVGMTRAKQKLYIYSIKQHYNKNLEVSRFVGETLIDVEQLKNGATVIHAIYGEGNIISIDNKKMKIKFIKSHKTMTLDMDFIVANRLIKMKY